MATSIRSEIVRVNGVKLHYRTAGQGPAMILLHGWPETSYAWRKILPRLAETFRVVAPDLRGMGDSDKPDSGYDVRTVATDIHELVSALGLKRPYLVGHDWGGLVARRFALDWPGESSRIAILDIVPHEQVLANLTADGARASWHFFFNAFPDLPELLLQNNVESFLRAFFRPKCHNPAVFIEECIQEYTRAYSLSGALRGGSGYYRNMFDRNRQLDRESAGQKIREPILCLWGNSGGSSRFDVLGMWQNDAENVRGHGVDECGHYMAEEQPEIVLQELLSFRES